MTDLWHALTSRFDLVLVTVAIVFAYFSNSLLAYAMRRDDEFVPLMRRWTDMLNAIAPEKPKVRPARSK